MFCIITNTTWSQMGLLNVFEIEFHIQIFFLKILNTFLSIPYRLENLKWLCVQTHPFYGYYLAKIELADPTYACSCGTAKLCQQREDWEPVTNPKIQLWISTQWVKMARRTENFNQDWLPPVLLVSIPMPPSVNWKCRVLTTGPAGKSLN